MTLTYSKIVELWQNDSLSVVHYPELAEYLIHKKEYLPKVKRAGLLDWIKQVIVVAEIANAKNHTIFGDALVFWRETVKQEYKINLRTLRITWLK